MILTWDDLMAHCSKLHAGGRARMLSVVIDNQPGTLIPYRRTEPGFYLRTGGPNHPGRRPELAWRTDSLIRDLETLVRRGRVFERADR